MHFPVFFVGAEVGCAPGICDGHFDSSQFFSFQDVRIFSTYLVCTSVKRHFEQARARIVEDCRILDSCDTAQ